MIRTIAVITCNGKPMALENCAHVRLSQCKATCAIFGTIAEGQCASCGLRQPILSDSPHRMRGLGDLVAAAVTLLFLGRSHIAYRIAGRVEGWLGIRREAAAAPDAPRKPRAARGCGCKARQAALNRAIPFRRNAH